MAVDAPVAGGRDLGEDLRVAVHDAGEVHHFGNPYRSVLVQELGQLGTRERDRRALELGGWHTTRGRDTEGERELGRSLGQATMPGTPKTFANLVRVCRYCGRPVGQHGADELVDPQLGGLECMWTSTKAAVSAAPLTIYGLVCLARSQPAMVRRR